jgi:hypothetical protein
MAKCRTLTAKRPTGTAAKRGGLGGRRHGGQLRAAKIGRPEPGLHLAPFFSLKLPASSSVHNPSASLSLHPSTPSSARSLTFLLYAALIFVRPCFTTSQRPAEVPFYPDAAPIPNGDTADPAAPPPPTLLPRLCCPINLSFAGFSSSLAPRRWPATGKRPKTPADASSISLLALAPTFFPTPSRAQRHDLRIALSPSPSLRAAYVALSSCRRLQASDAAGIRSTASIKALSPRHMKRMH